MSKLNQILDLSQKPVRPLFLSSYIPRKCGIATFTKDLTKAINDLNPHGLAQIVAMNNGEEYDYPPEVGFHIDRDSMPDYLEAARFINDSDADVLCLQHEYGLFGGGVGEYIFTLLSRVRQPIVSTLHTILANPTEEQRDALFRIAKISEAVVAMIPDAKERLERDYGIPADKVVVIHHGVTDRPKSTQGSKKKFGWEDRQVLLMTGLLNENKGADFVVKSLPAIREKFPNVLFVLVGQTHPEILKREGEKYRDGMLKMAKDLGVEDNIRFINEYVSLNDLLDYYDACDIYLTPHLDRQQITSGTLAYALGMGKACVSTPYVYAKEMLGGGAGKLVEFGDAGSISEAVIGILGDSHLRNSMESAAYKIGRSMSWPRVAERYLVLFRIVQEQYGIPDPDDKK